MPPCRSTLETLLTILEMPSKLTIDMVNDSIYENMGKSVKY